MNVTVADPAGCSYRSRS